MATTDGDEGPDDLRVFAGNLARFREAEGFTQEVAFFSAAGPQVRVQPDPVTGSPYSRPYFSALLRRDARVPVTPGPTDLSIFEALNKDRDPQSL